MSFEAAVISGGGDEATLAKSLVMAVKGPTQQWYSLLHPKSIQSWEQLKANILIDFQGFQPTGLTSARLVQLQTTTQRTLKPILQKIYSNQSSSI